MEELTKHFLPEDIEGILDYFELVKATNEGAESFNAKIKAFRGVRNVKFFSFRLSEIYA